MEVTVMRSSNQDELVSSVEIAGTSEVGRITVEALRPWMVLDRLQRTRDVAITHLLLVNAHHKRPGSRYFIEPRPLYFTGGSFSPPPSSPSLSPPPSLPSSPKRLRGR